MTLIVMGVTGATLWVTQKRVQATYQHLFEEQFQLQLKFFSDSRVRQLEAVATKCDSVAKNVRVVAAMEAAIREDDPEIIYDNLDTELEGLSRNTELMASPMRKMPDALRKRLPNAPSPDSLRDKAFGSMPTVAVVDAQGRVLEPKKQRPTFFKRPTSGNRSQQLRMFANRAPADMLEQQEIGYLAIEPEGGQVQLREFIVTPLVNQATEPPERLGALVIGFPVRDFGENAMYQFSEKTLMSGIWLDGKVYTQTIPGSVHEEVGVRIGEDVKTATTGTAREPVMLNGVPHRLFFKVLNPDAIFPPAAQVCLYSMRESLDEQAALRAQILGFGGFALLVGIGFILYISNGFSKPIEQLVEGTRRIQEGDFSVKVKVRSRDELGTLAKSFNEMAEELALKERYKAVLAQVTDKEVAEQLINGQMSLGGEVRQVSVLFCDIRGFTALTENMPPAEVITMLNEHMTAMNRVVHTHYGMVDKFVGDLIMAVFGAPKSYGNDAFHAVRCALDMMEERKRLNETSRHQFEIGIGVATGEVVAGCMGSQDRLNYTVLGERVNLASRLCSKAGSTELLIDETTYNQLPEGFIAEATEPLPLKGFSTPVPAFRLLEMNGVPVDVAPPTLAV